MDLCDGSREEFPAEGACVSEGGGVIAPLQRGLSARLTPAAQLQLTPHLEQAPGGQFVLRCDGAEYRVGETG